MKGWPLLLVATGACGVPAADAEPERAPDAVVADVVEQPLEPLPTILDRHDFGRRTQRFDLPGRLDEISGLAFSADGRLFGHDDERARIHEIDPATGQVGKRWDLGRPMVRGDFEGVTFVGERLFLVTSLGVLYEGREGADRAVLPTRATNTGVGSHCEVEGLDYDPLDDALLVACKVSTPDRGTIVVERIPVDPERSALQPLRISKAVLEAFGLDAEFDPSGIAVDPGGTFVLISGRHEALIEVDREGRVLAALSLSKDRHPQPEGIAFGPDGTLYIADEKNGRDARITAYARISAPEGGR